jgi:hypothetical protein
MKINTIFIKEEFKNIINNINLKEIIENDYQLILENNKIRIKFTTERWDDGITISLRDITRNQFYYPEDLELSKGFNDYEAHLNQVEKDILQGLKEGNDKIIYSFRILLEKYCQDVLGGNFSAVGNGKS